MAQTQEQRIQSAIRKLTPIAVEFLLSEDSQRRQRKFASSAEPLIKRFSKADKTRIVNAAIKNAARTTKHEDLFVAHMMREAERTVEWFEKHYEPIGLINSDRRQGLLKKLKNDRALVRKLR
jgi:hypothetical protein